jgi:glycosyltransferase involved in cell wall biosynthesis
MKIAIVVPTYNEAANIDELLRRLVAAIPASQIIVVDDASPDGTADIVRSFISSVPVKVIVRVGERGLGGALLHGMREALANGAEFIVTIDADLSHAPEDIIRLLAEAEDTHLTLGSRRVPGGSVAGWSRSRDLLSRAAAGISRFVFGLKTRDATTGFRVYRADFLKAIDPAAVRSRGYAFQEEMVMLAETGGFSVAEVPIEFVDRKEGRSKLSIVEGMSSLGSLVKLRCRAIDRRSLAWFGVLSLAALFARYYFSPLKGNGYDMTAFSYWAARGRLFNFFSFYSDRQGPWLSFPNYALYFPILAMLGPVAQATTEAGRVLLKTPAILGDIFLAAIVYAGAKPRWKLMAAAFVLFNPAVWYDSTIFGQTESIYTAFMALSVLFVAKRKYRSSWAWLVVAAFFKIQAIALLPLIAVFHFKGSGLKKMIVEMIPPAILAALIALPYIIVSSPIVIWRSLSGTVGMFPMVSVNAWNPWYLLHIFSFRWVSDAETVIGISYKDIGLVAFALAAISIIYALPKKPGRTVIFASAAAMCFAFFMLLTEMHERYSYPIIPFLAVLLSESPVVAYIAVLASVAIFLDINFIQAMPAMAHSFVQTVDGCVTWSAIFIGLFIVYFGWYMRRALSEKKAGPASAAPSK